MIKFLILSMISLIVFPSFARVTNCTGEAFMPELGYSDTLNLQFGEDGYIRTFNIASDLDVPILLEVKSTETFSGYDKITIESVDDSETYFTYIWEHSLGGINEILDFTGYMHGVFIAPTNLSCDN